MKKIADKGKSVLDEIRKTTAKGSKEVLKKASKVISEVVESEKGKQILDKTSKVASKIASSTADVGKKAFDETVDSVKVFAKKGKAIFKDDVENLKSECALLNKWTLPDVPHSVKSSAILAAAGLGILDNERELMRFSRSIMDTKGTVFEKVLGHFFEKEKIEQISHWMDKIPDAVYTGGGVTHRVRHGHDIEALIELIKGHDLAGAAEWFNHVALQDFWTPAGVPYLPFGNKTVFEWLSSLDFIGEELASELLSINFSEVMAILLIYRSSKAFCRFIKEQIREKRAKELWDRAIELEKLEDFSAANECYDQVLSYVPEKPEVAIWTAMNYFHCAQQQNLTEVWKSNLLRAYQIADSVRLKLIKDLSIPYYGGIKLSLRGFATTIMASSWISIAGKDNVQAIKGIVASGINDFIKMANSLKGKLNFRPFSAIANEALAFNLLIAAPFTLSTVHTPLTIHKRITDGLHKLSERKGDESLYAKELLNGFNKKYPLGRLTAPPKKALPEIN